MTTAVARPLPVLVPLIQRELEEGYSAGVEHYRAAGEMLVEANSQLKRGEFEPWIKRNFKNADGKSLSVSTARNYMGLARELEKNTTAVFSSIRAALGNQGYDGPAWKEPVRETLQRVNFEALRSERESKEKETRLIRQLALQLIDIGYKVLATKLHPDKTGGSVEAMARLNRVRKLLKDAV